MSRRQGGERAGASDPRRLAAPERGPRPDRFPFGEDVRAVLFDAGNTLICIDHGMITAALRGAGVDVAEELVREAEIRGRPRLDAGLSSVRLETLEMFELFASVLLEGVGASPPRPAVEAFRDAVVAMWPRMWKRVPADAHACFDVLARHGRRIAVVSNSDGTVREQLRVAGLVHRFEFVIDSHEVGVRKPDPRIFELAARRLDLPPSSCVYLGDLHSIDVVGARAAGMHAVLVDPLDVWGHVAAPRVASLSELASRITG